MSDALDVLFRPWQQDPPTLSADDRVLFLNARAHPALAGLGATLDLRQTFAPWADGLRRARLETSPDEDVVEEGAYRAVLVLLGRQRERNLARLGRGLLALAEGGELVACGAQREGGQRFAKEVAALAPDMEQQSKARCRVFRVFRTPELDLDTARAWTALDAPRPVLDGSFTSRPGVFAWDRADPGSLRLAARLPEDLGEVVADAGAGMGWLSAQVLERCPGVRTLHLIEADHAALALAEQNLRGRLGDRALHAHWCDATEAWPASGLDAIVTNPPFHEGGRADPAIGAAFLQRAREALRPGGRLWMVANRHLPYERTLSQTFRRTERIEERDGYKVYWAER